MKSRLIVNVKNALSDALSLLFKRDYTRKDASPYFLDIILLTPTTSVVRLFSIPFFLLHNRQVSIKYEFAIEDSCVTEAHRGWQATNGLSLGDKIPSMAYGAGQMIAIGQANVLAVSLLAKKLLSCTHSTREKLIVGPPAKSATNLALPLATNLHIAIKISKYLQQLTVISLVKTRTETVIIEI
ncbi:MAG: hypothetical protein ACSLEL_00955 [Candidatus Malihini olakiniferum]